MGRAQSLPPGGSCRQSALRNRLVTEEECGRQRWMIGNLKAYSRASYPTLVEAWYVVQTFRFPPAFLSRPLRGHPPPGGGDFPPLCGGGRFMNRPYIFALKLFVPIRRAETSGWSGGFSSPYGPHNPSGTSLAPAPCRRHKKSSSPYHAGPHGFYSTIDQQNVGQFVSGDSPQNAKSAVGVTAD